MIEGEKDFNDSVDRLENGEIINPIESKAVVDLKNLSEFGDKAEGLKTLLEMDEILQEKGFELRLGDKYFQKKDKEGKVILEIKRSSFMLDDITISSPYVIKRSYVLRSDNTKFEVKDSEFSDAKFYVFDEIFIKRALLQLKENENQYDPSS